MFSMIECKICGLSCKNQIPGIHLKKHGHTVASYEEEYGSSRDPLFLQHLKNVGKKGGGSPAAVAACNAISARNREVYAINPRLCPECTSVIPYEQDRRKKFCSSSCSAAFNNRKRSTAIYEAAKYRCSGCDMVLARAGKFCSKECQQDSSRRKLLAEWRDGKVRGGCDLHVSHALRAALIHEAGNKCTLCGWGAIHPTTGKCPLHIDHINGDCIDHSPGNLRVICPNCHSLTENFGSLNRNNKGRAVRRKERLAGKIS